MSNTEEMPTSFMDLNNRNKETQNNLYVYDSKYKIKKITDKNRIVKERKKIVASDISDKEYYSDFLFSRTGISHLNSEKMHKSLNKHKFKRLIQRLIDILISVCVVLLCEWLLKKFF